MGEWNAPHLENQDHLIMPHIDLCNIACGGHAGSTDIIKHTIKLAMANEVKVGAHPGYADKSNFGRQYVELSEQELKDLLRSQIDLFLNVADKMNVVPYHIKPHGALYHACNHREIEMNVLIDIVKNDYSHLVLLVFPESILHKAAEKEELTYMAESFIDRSYTDGLKLAPRRGTGSIITSVAKAKAQYNKLSAGEVITQSGLTKKIISQTTCIHGDNPNVLEILKSIHT